MDRITADAEALRLEELHSFGVLDSAGEQAYDDVVKLAALICDTPIALVSLVDEDRQWFKARVGMNEMETPRGVAFCAHAITDPHVLMEVPDALDDSRFVDNPLVTGDVGIRFYAGAPLVSASGAALGTVCVIDRIPRKLTDAQADALKALSRQVVQLLALRHANRQLELAHRQLREQNDELSEISLTDALTNLKNRRAFDRLLANEYARSKRTGSALVLLIVDVDHFKAYNDHFGHPAGDQALKAVAIAIQSQARAYDHVARLGGEEFAVILPDTHPEDALAVAERIRQAVQALQGLHRPVTVSVGAAMAEAKTDPADLVNRADRALYQAKQAGRNRVHTLL